MLIMWYYNTACSSARYNNNINYCKNQVVFIKFLKEIVKNTIVSCLNPHYIRLGRH